MSWVNDDGLVVKFGIEEATKRNIGAHSQVGPVHWVEVYVDWSEMPVVADGSVILNDNFALPTGAIIEDVTIRVPAETFVSAGGGTFNLGFIDADDRTSNADVDYFIQEATVAELNAGGTNVAGWAGGGYAAAPRVPLTQAKLLTWEVNTGAFTAGKTVVRIMWSMEPVNGEDTLIWTKP
jgi:hypothetical protein